MTIEGQTAIVTGGAKGIGRHIALSLLAEGVNVAVADIDEINMAETLKAAERYSGTAKSYKMNVADYSQIKNVVTEVKNEFETIDILVNNAGICEVTRFDEIEEAEWDKVMDVNLKGSYFCIKAILPVMKEQGYGKIINMSSLAGKTGGILVGAHYSASKAGIVSLTKSAAKFAASFGVNVNAVSPGLIDTEMTEDLDYDLDQVPLKRMGKPEDVAEAVKFLVSKSADYLTGEIIDVDGGILMD